MPTSNEQQPAGATRTKLIEAARDGWVSRLIDLSRRNNLLFYRTLPTTSVEVSLQSPCLAELLDGDAVTGGELLGEGQDRPGRLVAIARKALENSEEKGLQTLYLAVGFLTWTAEDGGRDPSAPVYLVPLEMKKKGKELTGIEIKVVGEPKVNPVLLHVLRESFNIDVPEAELCKVVSPDDTDESADSTLSMLDRYAAGLELMMARVTRVPGVKTDSKAAISNFSFAKLALVNDLQSAGSLLTQNGVVAAIAGDAEARNLLGSSQVAVDPRGLDTTPPEQEFCVVEADSSQQCAIAGIAAGQNAVVHGPPGTGKSQTITNLIATLVASGKTVLFVAEKRAALEVVQARLEKAGLDHVSMDLHGAELSPKKVMERVARTLTLVKNSKPAQAEVTHRQFQDRRNRLNAHDLLMHSVSERCGKTLYEIEGCLLRLPETARTSVRWRGPELAKITSVKADAIRVLLREAAPFKRLFLRDDPSPWTGVPFHSGKEVQDAIDNVQTLAHESLPQMLLRCAQLKSIGLSEPNDFASLNLTVALLRSVTEWLSRYKVEVFSTDLVALLADLVSVKDGGLKALWLSWTDESVKAARKRAVDFRLGGNTGLKALCKELESLRQVQETWRERSTGASTPRAFVELFGLDEASSKVQSQLREVQRLTGQSGLELLEFRAIGSKLAPYASDSLTPHRILKLSAIEDSLKELGAQRLVDDLRTTRSPVAIWIPRFDDAWLNSALDELAIRDPEVKGFVGTTHNGYVDDFQQLDVDRLRLAKDRVRRVHAERTIAAMNAHPKQEALIRQEASKSRAFKPLRKTFQEAKDVMTAVCPCWLASPLSVAQLIHPDVSFDYVIFDEGSQILPEDAISAIMRGKYLVVAGDNKQLPPTGFFAAGVEEEEGESEALGFESLLDMVLPFAHSFHLNWHYRSRDEALIAFSNRWMYDDRLVTFPGVGGVAAIIHVCVNHIPQGDGQEESSSAEVKRVVELVMEHAHLSPTKSLGVIAMGIKHAMRIQGALDLAQASHPESSEFFDPGRADRFFVKNLERVQGDERDCIILTVGYGKDRAGKLPLRFGPILAAGGMRRLNVAVTRARERMTLVSSFAHTDIDTTKVREGTGLEFLRNYLQYAASYGTLLNHGQVTNEPMNDFEADIYEALTARGLKLVPQVGCSSFRIDFGVCHPMQPGRFVMAIEADGATYHSSYTARDRDRLRQQMLENLGWRFHRIWSTDWFLRKHEEAERTVAAFDRAVAESDRHDATSAPETPEPVDPDPAVEVELSSRRSSVFPPIPKRSSISDYSAQELKALYAWVCSDGQLRTHDEIADEMFAGLPFGRRGSKIEAALRDTITRCSKLSPVK